MKKMVALVLMLVYVLSLGSCSDENFDEFEPDTDKNNFDSTINEDESNDKTDNNDQDQSNDKTDNNNQDESNDKTDNNNQNDNEDNNENNIPVDNDAVLKAELTSKFGMPFRLWRTQGMSLWEFTISENSAERGYHNSMEGSFWQKNLSWEIKNGELVITGDWNETFIIDLEAGEVISKTDEAVYKIVKEQN